MFLTGPEIDETEFVESSVRLNGGQEHRGIVEMAGLQVFESFIHRNSGTFAKLSQGFLVGKCAALAAPEVIAGEKRTFGPGQGFEDDPHRGVWGKIGCLHGWRIAVRGRIARWDF